MIHYGAEKGNEASWADTNRWRIWNWIGIRCRGQAGWRHRLPRYPRLAGRPMGLVDMVRQTQGERACNHYPRTGYVGNSMQSFCQGEID